MKLKDLGYNNKIKKQRADNNLNQFEIGRIAQEHKERYIVKTEKGDFEAEITGKLRFSAKNSSNFPAVGDWVAISITESGTSIIHHVYDRFSVFSRQAVGKFGEIQIIATNIDYAFIVQSVDNNFNLNRLERYLTICNSAKIKAIIVLTKTDLIENKELTDKINLIKNRINIVSLLTISNITQEGIETLKFLIEKGKTYCLLGSSGVGKSSLLNNLLGEEKMKTGAISDSNSKGKHVTSHREMTILGKGGIIIDTPGMREIGIIDENDGLKTTFDKIFELAENCKFKNCSHTQESGCAVIEAIESGELDENLYQNYLKIEREKEHFESTIAERRKKDKDFGKMVKKFKKLSNKNRD